MCGIIGIFSQKAVATELYDGLIHLQHRGQDAAGMCTFDNKQNRFHLKKGSGYVRDVFQEADMNILDGNWGIGHTRYGTSGSRYSSENAQPFTINSPYGLAMAHNGDLTNYIGLKKELADIDKRHCNTTSDIEVILQVFASKLQDLNGNSHQENNLFDGICQAVKAVFERCRGGYSVIGIIAGKGMIAFRDPHGIRPFVWGKKINNDDFKKEFGNLQSDQYFNNYTKFFENSDFVVYNNNLDK
jgi:amidophosphoribosyltransferase